ncbi:MAG TPA: histidine phosphatase family protein, partial [Planctomycetaceae bacterium]|nr:histidine phosphatase family protein [Planctomycetaceae bacterium]
MNRTERHLFLVRHGATDENVAQPYRLQGQRVDPPLNELGRRQAERTAELLRDRPIRHAFSSPLRRAVETATIIVAAHGLEVSRVEELIECDVGRWEGLSWAEVRRRDPEAFGRFMADP